MLMYGCWQGQGGKVNRRLTPSASSITIKYSEMVEKWIRTYTYVRVIRCIILVHLMEIT